MRLAFDIDSREVVDPTDLTSPIGTLTFRRGEIIPFEVILAQSGVAVKLEDSTVEAYLTPATTFATLLASETAIEPVNDGIETIYRGELDLDESAINSLFSSGTTLEANATLQIRAESGSLSYRSEPVSVVIQNSYTP